ARRMDLDALAHAPVDAIVCARALQTQADLARRGGVRHRGAKLADYLIAAAQARLPILHYEADYEVIASVTHQAHEWIARRGSL
ncbi:MAG: VapC toxin family PIN domain ribonuclease, partial [Solirubrobacterales bacterium]